MYTADYLISICESTVYILFKSDKKRGGAGKENLNGPCSMGPNDDPGPHASIASTPVSMY